MWQITSLRQAIHHNRHTIRAVCLEGVLWFEWFISAFKDQPKLHLCWWKTVAWLCAYAKKNVQIYSYWCLRTNEKFKIHILCIFIFSFRMNSQGQTPAEWQMGVALSGQSMFMLLIWRIPPLLTGEMRKDYAEVERRAPSSSTAKTNELPHCCLDYLIIVPLPHIDLYPCI